MNIQEWNKDAVLQKLQAKETETESSEFMERILRHQKKVDKGKTLTISSFFECDQQAKFIVAIAKFATVFNINIDSIPCLSKLSKKEISYIKEYNFQSVLADTNRKQFAKFFQKSIEPQLNMSTNFKNLSGMILIIQHPESEIQKPKIKILNHENLIHSILNNVKIVDGCQQLNKFLDFKYKRISTVVCYDKVKQYSFNKEIIELLMERFQEVFYIAVANDEEMQTIYYKVEGEMEEKASENQTTKTRQGSNYMLVGTQPISLECEKSLCEFYNKYLKIDNLINSQISNQKGNPKISKTVFKENQLCISYYGIYYNFISMQNLENTNDEILVQQKFLQKFFQEKEQKQKKSSKTVKKALNRKLGHYPSKISKGSKVCCVCEDNKKKKSRYKCEKCSDTYSRDIALCIDHFKEYHDNMYKYIPKGVRKGAYKNELMHFIESDKTQEKGEQKVNVVNNKSKEDLNKVFAKWEQKAQSYQASMNCLAWLYTQNQSYPYSYCHENLGSQLALHMPPAYLPYPEEIIFKHEPQPKIEEEH